MKSGYEISSIHEMSLVYLRDFVNLDRPGDSKCLYLGGKCGGAQPQKRCGAIFP